MPKDEAAVWQTLSNLHSVLTGQIKYASIIWINCVPRFYNAWLLRLYLNRSASVAWIKIIHCVIFCIFSSDRILQKAAKEENGEMKYFTGEEKRTVTIIQWSILRFASIMWEEIQKYNQRHGHMTICHSSSSCWDYSLGKVTDQIWSKKGTQRYVLESDEKYF